MNRSRPAVAMWIALGAVGLAVLAGCSTPAPDAASSGAGVPNAQPRTGVPNQFQLTLPPAAAAAGARGAPAGTVASGGIPDHLNPTSALNLERSVFFAYDDSNVAPEFMPIVERHAKYLSANVNVSVRIEGHTDERGGPEYNLALGQRRAESVARALRLLGVTGNRVEAVSYGEERPVEKGQSEAAWSRNRRADMTYPRR